MNLKDLEVAIWQRLSVLGYPVFHGAVPAATSFPFIRFVWNPIRELPAFLDGSSICIGSVTVDVFSKQEVSTEAESIGGSVIEMLDRLAVTIGQATYYLGFSAARLRWEEDGCFWVASLDFLLHCVGKP